MRSAIKYTLLSGGVAPYLGQVATRSFVPAGLVGGLTTLMSRSAHISRQTITSLRIVVPNFYVNGSFAEVGPGAATTVTASVEYPAGTFKQIKFSGVAAGTVPDGGVLLSDEVTVSIPNNTKFFIRMYLPNANGQPLDGSGFQASETFGDFLNNFDGDRTMSGTISSQFAGYTVAPLAIVAPTTRPSIMFLGTSRSAGINDVYDTSGDIGPGARALGPSFAYINAARASDSLASYIASHTNRAALAQYVSHIIIDMANDPIGGSLATTQANFQTVMGYFPTKKILAVTTNPYTTGAWTLANQTDQTVAADFGPWNTWLKALPSPLKRVFDLQTVTATGVANKWNADGTVGKWTSDGIHESQYANLQIVASGVIPPSAITR